mmetsp:Transcript_2499/g.7513  ORF Transcript_2499/g.7513 Transcript_2499/m.7513 type:complete len:310 (-) Transcript_2499:273-1202(-)
MASVPATSAQGAAVASVVVAAAVMEAAAAAAAAAAAERPASCGACATRPRRAWPGIHTAGGGRCRGRRRTYSMTSATGTRPLGCHVRCWTRCAGTVPSRWEPSQTRSGSRSLAGSCSLTPAWSDSPSRGPSAGSPHRPGRVLWQRTGVPRWPCWLWQSWCTSTASSYQTWTQCFSSRIGQCCKCPPRSHYHLQRLHKRQRRAPILKQPPMQQRVRLQRQVRGGQCRGRCCLRAATTTTWMCPSRTGRTGASGANTSNLRSHHSSSRGVARETICWVWQLRPPSLAANRRCFTGGVRVRKSQGMQNGSPS